MGMVRLTRGIVFVLAIVCSAANVHASQAPTPQAELYTMGPGDELFTKFGHAAICVTISAASPSLCFNYGTTDFSRPIGLTWDVLLGRAEFFVSVAEESDMVSSFESQDRTIYRQTLPLSEEQVMALAERLYHDAQAENRGYIYDHFLDNCATKPRDLIDDVAGGVLRAMSGNESHTYREFVDEKLGYSVLLIALSDLFLGRRLDRPLTAYESMFLPCVLRDAVTRQFGSEAEIVYMRAASLPPSRPEVARRWIGLLWIGFALATGLALVWGSERYATAARRLVGIALGGLGALLFLMAIVSPEPEIRYNENLLIFLPTDLLYLCGMPKLIRSYARLRFVQLVLVGSLVVGGVLIQPLGSFWCAASVSAAAIGLRKAKPSA
jgi:hypothetical protein